MKTVREPVFATRAAGGSVPTGTTVGPSRLIAATLLSLAFLSVAAPGAATAADPPRDRVRSLAEIRHERIVMQKWDLSCGAAALATLLTYDLGDPVSEQQVAGGMLRQTEATRVRSRGGFSLLDMQAFAEARGYQADGYGEVTLTDLARMLPVIVPVDFHGYDHFVVVRRIEQGQVFFADPAYGRRSVSYREFERAWPSRIAFVVIVPS